MNVGDLVRYGEDAFFRRNPNPRDDLGIVTQTGTHANGHAQCHVVWFTCNKEGWWSTQNLELVSENR